jgi:hypothetical protein
MHIIKRPFDKVSVKNHGNTGHMIKLSSLANMDLTTKT